MSFDKKFVLDEFPIVLDGRDSALLINGQVVVAFDGPDDWYIDDILLDGWREPTKEEKEAGATRSTPILYRLDGSNPLWGMIANRFEDAFEDAIAEAAAEEYGYGRSDYAEHCTYRVDANGTAW